MTSHPAFEEALRTGDHSALLSLYTTALAQRDRAEAIIRALLNPGTSAHTIGEICEENLEPIHNKSNADPKYSVQHRSSCGAEPGAIPHHKYAPLRQKSKASAPKPNLADSI